MRKYNGDQNNETAIILDILKARRGLGVSDPRDMVYAHLEMLGPSVRSRIKIDYSKSKARVYEDISWYIIATTKCLSVLSLMEDIDLGAQPELPSWVPDLSRCPSSGQIRALNPLYTSLIQKHIDIENVAPGVLAINGTYYGRIIYILPDTLLPHFPIQSIYSITEDEIAEWEKSTLEFIFQPNSFNLVELLLRGWLQRSPHLTQQGSKHLLHKSVIAAN